MTLRDALAAVRGHGLSIRHDGAGGLAVQPAVPGARCPRSLLEGVSEHRPALAAPCAVCSATVYRPCEVGAERAATDDDAPADRPAFVAPGVGAVCDLADCPYRPGRPPFGSDKWPAARAARAAAEAIAGVPDGAAAAGPGRGGGG